MTTYNGHRSWAYWNVSLWINNDEGLYRGALACVKATRTRREAAHMMLDILRQDTGQKHPETPDGALYSVAKIQAAMRGMTP